MNEKPIPFFKRFVIQNFPFIEEDFDALTNYQLFCKVVEYLNKVIGSQNEVTQQMEYVLNYFNNLDVQDEINNKLDQMAESGELTDLIAGYLNLRGILAYDSVADMKAADNLVDGSLVETYGFYTKGDGGGAKYFVRNVTTSDNIDEMFIIALSDNLVAVLVYSDVLDIRKLGAKTDSSEDISSIITNAISKTIIKKIIVSGNTKISTGLTINRQLEIDLQGGTIDASELPANTYLFSISTRYDGKFILKNGHIIGNDNAHFIKNIVSGTTWGYSFNLENLEVIHFEKIVDGYNIFNSMITDCLFSSNNGYFVYNADIMTNQNTFRNCYFKSYDQDSSAYPDYKFDLTKAKNWLFNQCSFEQQKTSIKATNSSHIVIKSCEFEQQNYVANDRSAVFIDGSNYIYGLIKTYEDVTFREDVKQHNIFTNIHTSDENADYIRRTIRNADTAAGNDSFGLTSAGGGWVPLLRISPQKVGFYQPVNTIQVKSNGAVESQNIDITDFNKGSSGDAYIINVYTVVKGSNQSTHRMWKTPIMHINSYITRVGTPELVYTSDWSGQISFGTTITVTVTDNTVTITPSQSVQLYSFAKVEYLGDNLW